MLLNCVECEEDFSGEEDQELCNGCANCSTYPEEPGAKPERCSNCQAEFSWYEYTQLAAWRWNGRNWEHQCNLEQAQAGYFKAS